MPFHSIAGAIDTVQRIIEDENLQIRRMLRKYESSSMEQQRRILYDHRMELLLEGAPAAQLHAIDERWADYLAAVEDLRDGVPWVSLGGKDPFPGFIQEATRLFEEVRLTIGVDAEEIPDEPVERGATWTYVINDQPFGSLTERLAAGLRRRVRDLLATRR